MRTIGPVSGEEMFRDWDRRIRLMEQMLPSLSRDRTYPIDQRPDPTTTMDGTRIVDLDLGRPIWCIGGAWVDAMGNAV